MVFCSIAAFLLLSGLFGSHPRCKLAYTQNRQQGGKIVSGLELVMARWGGKEVNSGKVSINVIFWAKK